MDLLVSFLDAYGYWLLAGIGFAEFAGLPIAAAPVLVVGGAMTGGGGVLDLLPAVGCAGTGALLADAAWYAAGRWKGDRLVDGACGLTSNPKACIYRVGGTLERVGGPYIVPAKLVPGTANLVAVASGITGIPPRSFLLHGSLGALLWAGLYTLLGRIFSSRVEAVLEVLVAYGRWVLVAAVVLVLGAGVWRIVRMRIHRRHHADRRAASPAAEGPEGAIEE